MNTDAVKEGMATTAGNPARTNLAVHETLELHEITAFKTLCLTKSKTMQALVDDQDLRNLMQQDAQTTSRQLQELDSLLAKAVQ